MKLMKLLTVGRSFKGGKSAGGQYKVQQILLPKFASSVRPSKEAVARAAARLPALANAASIVAASKEDSVSSGLDKTQKIPAGTVLKRKPEPSEVSFKAKLAAFLGKPIAIAKKRLFPVRSRKKSSVAPRQAEWNLGKITVARNDLSEADLEIVTPGTSQNVQPTRRIHLPDLVRFKNSGREWIKMTASLFKTSSPFESRAAEEATKVAARRGAEQRELAERI